MAPHARHPTLDRVGLAAIVALAVVLVALALLPSIETNRWFVRMADFPRVQLLVATVAVMVATGLLQRRRPAVVVPIALALLAAAVAHAITLWPYRPGGHASVAHCSEGSTFKVLVVNVLMTNRTAAPILEAVGHVRPDVFLALETDAFWDRALAPLSASMPYHVEEIGGRYYGMHLFSRLPLKDPEVRHLAGQDTPAIFTGVMLNDGTTIGFVGLHPRPPHPSQPATGRDAQLYEAALAVRDHSRPTVLAGDLNATPWETSVERMRRIGGLIDPRQGYGYLPTYSANSWWRSWPLDHVFYGRGFAAMSLERLGTVGSDHYPYVARLCRTGGGGSPPALQDRDLEEARTAIAAATAAGSTPR